MKSKTGSIENVSKLITVLDNKQGTKFDIFSFSKQSTALTYLKVKNVITEHMVIIYKNQFIVIRKGLGNLLLKEGFKEVKEIK